MSRSNSLRESDPRRFNEWIVDDRIGGGGQGTTFLVHDESRDAVVKWFHPTDEPARVEREARLLAQLTDVPGIPEVLDLGELHARAWVAMERIDGDTLANVIRDYGHYSLEKWSRLVGDLSAVLDAVHEAGVVHRDIKPPNIMIDSTGLPWLVDFGLGVADDAHSMTNSEMVAGTPQYASPELWLKGLGALTPAADVWCLGVSLLEAALGYLPGPEAVAREDGMAGLPAWQRETIAACLQNDPDDRCTAFDLASVMVGSKTATVLREWSVSAHVAECDVWPLVATGLVDCGFTELAIAMAVRHGESVERSRVLARGYLSALFQERIGVADEALASLDPHLGSIVMRDGAGGLDREGNHAQARELAASIACSGCRFEALSTLTDRAARQGDVDRFVALAEAYPMIVPGLTYTWRTFYLWGEAKERLLADDRAALLLQVEPQRASFRHDKDEGEPERGSSARDAWNSLSDLKKATASGDAEALGRSILEIPDSAVRRAVAQRHLDDCVGLAHQIATEDHWSASARIHSAEDLAIAMHGLASIPLTDYFANMYVRYLLAVQRYGEIPQFLMPLPLVQRIDGALALLEQSLDDNLDAGRDHALTILQDWPTDAVERPIVALLLLAADASGFRMHSGTWSRLLGW
jgi:predicted Ser/Thr protein kinase